jgi:hypothetical protein
MTTSNNCPLSKSVDFLGGGRGLAHCEYLQLCIREGAGVVIKEHVARNYFYFVSIFILHKLIAVLTYFGPLFNFQSL